MNSQPVPFRSHRYRLIAPLGKGAMGVVYRALDRLTGHSVALKRVQVAPQALSFASRTNTNDTDTLLLALAQEFKVLASLRHPNIISVLDYGFDDNRQPYFTMELLDQPQTVLAAGRNQPLAIQIDLLIQSLQALAYLHRRGILHRDFKPDNVLVCQGRVRVLDFGLSIARSQVEIGDVSGTLYYLAPEILEGGAHSEAADLYGFGVIAYEMLVGQHPFVRDTNAEIEKLIIQILDKQPDLYPLLELALPGGKRILSAIVWKLLEKQPVNRYASATMVMRDLYDVLGQPLPPESEGIRESFLQAASFVGRESELAQLNNALEGVVHGVGSAWLIGGESGVGKSRILDELRTRALVAGAMVLRGQAVEGGGLPYQLWREPLRSLVVTSELSDMEAGMLKGIVPDLERILARSVVDAPKLSHEAELERLGGTLIALLKGQAAPIVILLEDLQWSVESLIILQRLNQSAREQPWLVIGTYRDDERPHLPDELPWMRPIKLNRLNAEETIALSTAILGETGQQAELLKLLQQQTEGNTFFIVEVLRTLAEDAGRLSAIGQMILPNSVTAQGVRALLQRRLSRIPARMQPLLKLAALSGREVDRAVLQQLAPNLDLEHWLHLCSEAAVLEVYGETWRFAHDKLREEVIFQLEATEKRQLYRIIAEAIEATYPQDNSRSEMLLGYWRAAEDPGKALPYLLFVTRERVEMGVDFPETQRLLQDGLAWSRTLPDGKKEQSALLKRYGDTYFRQGDYATARQHYQDALHLAEQVEDALTRSSAMHGLGMIAWRQGDIPLAHQYIKDGVDLAQLEGNQDQIVTGLIMVAILYSEQADYGTAQEYFQQCIAIAETNGDTAAITLCLINLGNNAQTQGKFALAQDYLSKALASARAMQARRLIAHALSILSTVAQRQGELASALDYMTQSLAVDREIDDHFGLAYDLIACATIQLELSAFAEGRSMLQEGLQLARKLGGAPMILHGLLGFARLALCNGDAQQAAEICGIVAAHPSLTPGMQQGDLEKLLADLTKILPPDSLIAAQTRGRELDMQSTIARLLE